MMYSDWLKRWKHLFPKGRILDVTCGSGKSTAQLMLDGRRVLACGEDVSALERFVGNPLLTLECRDLETEEWPWETERFAGAVVTEAVLPELFERIWDSLVPEGVLIVEMPTAADRRIKDLPCDRCYPEEGKLLQYLPKNARLIAFEEGSDEEADIRTRLVAVKAGNPTPYAYPLN